MELTWNILYVVHILIATGGVIVILRRPREPRAMMAWILTFILIPEAAIVFYSLLGMPRQRRHRRRRRRRRAKLVRSMSQKSRPAESYQIASPPTSLRDDPGRLIQLAARLSKFRPTTGNDVEIYFDANQMFEVLQDSIRQARHHVHMEYFIFHADDAGKVIRDLMIEKCREGVQCRLLLDFIGCWFVSHDFLKPLKEAGAEVAFYSPVIPWRGRWRINFRNHRKILLVDGVEGYTGSQNIGNEYMGRKSRKYGPYRDTLLKLTGPVAQQMQEVFIEDWHYTTGHDLASDEYFPEPTIAGDQIVQVIPSGPDYGTQALHHMLFAAVGMARKSVCIITPYFVPDEAMLLALQTAAYRGIRVQLLIPSRSDHRVVLWAGRSYYEQLCETGVEIYEYDYGLLHSKVVVIDRHWALVGSANIDERSFRLNYELTAVLHDAESAKKLCEDFESLKNQSRRINRGIYRQKRFPESLILGAARLASPVL